MVSRSFTEETGLAFRFLFCGYFHLHYKKFKVKILYALSTIEKHKIRIATLEKKQKEKKEELPSPSDEVKNEHTKNTEQSPTGSTCELEAAESDTESS